MSPQRQAVYADNSKRSMVHAKGHVRLGDSYTACGKKIAHGQEVPDSDKHTARRCKICMAANEVPPKESTDGELKFSPEMKIINEMVAIKLAIFDLVEEFRIARGAMKQ